MGTLTVNGSSHVSSIMLAKKKQSTDLQGESSDRKSANLLFPLESKRKIRVLYIIDIFVLVTLFRAGFFIRSLPYGN